MRIYNRLNDCRDYFFDKKTIFVAEVIRGDDRVDTGSRYIIDVEDLDEIRQKGLLVFNTCYPGGHIQSRYYPVKIYEVTLQTRIDQEIFNHGVVKNEIDIKYMMKHTTEIDYENEKL